MGNTLNACFGSKQKDHSQVDGGGFDKIRTFTYNELRRATDDFSDASKIGHGGFGAVYKGKLKDGTLIAVKVLGANSKQGVREFLSEIWTISDIKHENLVTLLGCCVERTHRILVYVYCENGSLAQTLLGLGSQSSMIQFNWKTRVKICIGIARGLAHLHEEINPHIIHRDIKASNILLDKDLCPKISDFGLAKLLPIDATHVSTRVAGTIGYLAPEYAMRGHATRKSDVYSFGVLLLEIVTGRCNTNTRLPYEDQFLLDRAWMLYEQGELEAIIDCDLGEDLDVEEACRFLKIGLLCAQGSGNLRPKMTHVVEMLTGERAIPMSTITKPAVIDDFRKLKIKSEKQVDEAHTSSSKSSAHTSTLSSDAAMLMGTSSGLDF